ncbi:hypothetical protein B0H10DRAFT_2439262 [Mycena sp. CBHHK59/15]|nr:hypothetical protein B0H10DRAFT_2439262 [Mycena sp. CBHHK59/15]
MEVRRDHDDTDDVATVAPTTLVCELNSAPHRSSWEAEDLCPRPHAPPLSTWSQRPSERSFDSGFLLQCRSASPPLPPSCPETLHTFPRPKGTTFSFLRGCCSAPSGPVPSSTLHRLGSVNRCRCGWSLIRIYLRCSPDTARAGCPSGSIPLPCAPWGQSVHVASNTAQAVDAHFLGQSNSGRGFGANG